MTIVNSKNGVPGCERVDATNVIDRVPAYSAPRCVLKARLACGEVFALGTRSSAKRMDMGNFTSRAPRRQS